MTDHEELAKRAWQTGRPMYQAALHWQDMPKAQKEYWLAVARALVPEGWAVVPVEPTREMVQAHAEAMHGITSVEDVLRAVIAAAPSP